MPFGEETEKRNEEHHFEYEEIDGNEQISDLIKVIANKKRIFYYIDAKENKTIKAIYIYNEENSKINYISLNEDKIKSYLREIFENKEILKCGTNLKKDWRLLKENEINPENMMFDVHIAGYILNSTKGKYSLEDLSNEYLNFDILGYGEKNETEKYQINLFDVPKEENKLDERKCAYVYVIYRLYEILKRKIE